MCGRHDLELICSSRDFHDGHGSIWNLVCTLCIADKIYASSAVVNLDMHTILGALTGLEQRVEFCEMAQTCSCALCADLYVAE